jgi:hypothetical protein
MEIETEHDEKYALIYTKTPHCPACEIADDTIVMWKLSDMIASSIPHFERRIHVIIDYTHDTINDADEFSNLFNHMCDLTPALMHVTYMRISGYIKQNAEIAMALTSSIDANATVDLCGAYPITPMTIISIIGVCSTWNAIYISANNGGLESLQTQYGQDLKTRCFATLLTHTNIDLVMAIVYRELLFSLRLPKLVIIGSFRCTPTMILNIKQSPHPPHELVLVGTQYTVMELIQSQHDDITIVINESSHNKLFNVMCITLASLF